MFQSIKVFQSEVAGQQYLFSAADFYLLQAWVTWMCIYHDHKLIVSDPTQSEAQAVPASNVVIYQEGVHSTRPVGFEDTTIGTYLTIQDHVTNADIHSDPTSDDQILADGQLVARGWTEPIKVLAVISNPLFEIHGCTDAGPVFLPFPHDNMAPQPAVNVNRLNNIDPNAEYINQAPLSELVDPELTGGVRVASRGDYRAHEVQYDELNKRPVFPGAKYPWPADAKAQRSTAFLNEYSQFLYLIPPYLETPLKINPDIDKVTNGLLDDTELAVFYHTPLFVDARSTYVLDNINRSGVDPENIFNWRDLISIFATDDSKRDVFDTRKNQTCWLTRYDPIAVQDERGSKGWGAFLHFNDYHSEVNQFLSQVNYKPVMEGDAGTYFDFPFRTVTVDFSVHESIDESLREPLVRDGFPNCFYKTNFSLGLAEAGGHNNDSKRPKEDFYFDIYPTGLIEFKDWYRDTFGAFVPNFPSQIWSAFDRLNLPYGFNDGKRQVLILKDPNVQRSELQLKRNPYHAARLCAYQIVEGYVSVPYEAYVTNVAPASDATFGQIKEITPVPGDPSAGGAWKKTTGGQEGTGDSGAPPGSLAPIGGESGGGTGGGGGAGDSGGAGDDGDGGTGGTGTGGEGWLKNDPCDPPLTFIDCLKCCGVSVAPDGKSGTVNSTSADGTHCLSGSELVDFLNDIADCLRAKCPGFFVNVVVSESGIVVVGSDGNFVITPECKPVGILL